MKILYINSDDLENNKYVLDNAIEGRYKLVSFIFTNNIFNINDTNNKIYFNENGNNKEAQLTNGYYDISTIKDNIVDSMNNVADGSITGAIDTNTNKITITNTLNFYFTFGTNTNNSARKILGYENSDGTNATSQTSSNPIDLNTLKHIWINIDENKEKNVIGTNYFASTFFINGLGDFGEVVRYINNDNFNQYITLNREKSLEIKIHDDDYNTINLNSNYVMILKSIDSITQMS